MEYGPVVALLAGVAAIVAAGCGLVIVVRNARDKGRHAALLEADTAEAALELARAQLVECRAALHDAHLILAEHGLAP